VISSRSTDERRRDPRLEGNIPVKICQDGGDLVTETLNVSRSGAYCRVNQYIEPMTKLKIHLLLSFPKSTTKKISCEGVVVRSESSSDDGQYNIAVFFSDITKRDAECITDYVDTYLKTDEAAQ
jgi:hypothetical protein